MSGFDNEVVYGSNVDFSGGSPVSGKMQTDGQLLIGTTSLNAGGTHINVGTIVGSGGITVGYSSPNITLGLSGEGVYKSLSPYIVGTDIHSSYTTIASAIAQAVADGASSTNPANIYIKPKTTGGPYTENLTLSDGINLVGFGKSTTILGQITFSTAGSASVTGLRLQTNSSFFLVVGGSSITALKIFSCFFNITNSTGISYTTLNASSSIDFQDCQANITTTLISFYAMSSTGEMNFDNCLFENPGVSAALSNNSAGAVNFRICTINFGVSTSSSGALGFNRSVLYQVTNTIGITYNGATIGHCSNSLINSNASSALSVGTGGTVNIVNTVIETTNTNAITGLGTVNYANLSFVLSGTNINTTTQNVLTEGNSIRVGANSSGLTNSIILANSSNTASSTALSSIAVGGATAGDPFTTYTVTGVTNWSQGIDNSDADAFVLSSSTALGTTNAMRMSTAGQMNLPLQPAFLATHTVNQDNVTGNGTVVTVNFTTEVFDQGGNYDGTNTFTAPITGKYLLTGSFVLANVAAGTNGSISVVTANRQYFSQTFNYSAIAVPASTVTVSNTVIADMDAGDTAVIQAALTGIGADTADLTSNALRTYFAGSLLC